MPLLAEGYNALRVSGAARVDGRALREALLRAARRNGARQISGDAVLQTEGKRITGAAVDGEVYAADAVVVCAGAWAPSLLLPLGLRFQVSYQKGQILHLQTTGQEDTGSWPVVIPPTDQYLLSFADGRIVIGATHENNVDGFDTRVTAGGMQEVLNKGLELAPVLADSTIQEVRVGFRPFTPGFLPVIGAVPGWEGVLAANGLGASGLTMGPFIGSQLAKLALGLTPDIELEDYELSKAMEQQG